MSELIPQAGDYKQLLCYQKSDVIFQITYFFCEKFLCRGDRTIDQMQQAARSGKQNIVEGVSAGPTSLKTEIRLVNVAKASLKELLEDYEDYLKTRGLPQWKKGSEEYEAMRNLGRLHNDAKFFMDLIEKRSAGTIANIAIILLNQTDYLIFRFLERLSKTFIENGGFSERMSNLRRKSRGF